MTTCPYCRSPRVLDIGIEEGELGEVTQMLRCFGCGRYVPAVPVRDSAETWRSRIQRVRTANHPSPGESG